MMRRLLLTPFLLLLFYPIKLSGQERPVLPHYDSMTYQQYLASDWKALLKTGKSMLEQNQDFFFLRMRMGIAALKLNDYNKAETNFRKALEFNPFDQDALMLYYTAIRYNLRLLEAGSLAGRMSASSREQLELSKATRIYAMHLDGGYNIRSDIDGLDFNRLTSGFGLYGYERVYRNNWFTDAGANILAKPNLMFYIGGQLIEVDVVDRFAYLQPELELSGLSQNEFGNAFYYSLLSKPAMHEKTNRLSQRSAYLQAQYSPTSRTRIIGNLHLQHVNSDFTTSEIITVTLSDTAFISHQNNEVQMFTADYSSIGFNNVNWATTDFNAGISGIINFGKIQGIGGLSIGRINDKKTTQINLGMNIQPFGNPNLYAHAELFAVQQSRKRYVAVKSRLGARLHPRSWLEVEMLTGRLNNLSDQYGYILYNHPELVNFRTEAIYSFELTSRLLMQIRYRLLLSDRSYYFFESNNTDIQSNTYPINAQTITGGLKWHF